MRKSESPLIGDGGLSIYIVLFGYRFVVIRVVVSGRAYIRHLLQQHRDL